MLKLRPLLSMPTFPHLAFFNIVILMKANPLLLACSSIFTRDQIFSSKTCHFSLSGTLYRRGCTVCTPRSQAGASKCSRGEAPSILGAGPAPCEEPGCLGTGMDKSMTSDRDGYLVYLEELKCCDEDRERKGKGRRRRNVSLVVPQESSTRFAMSISMALACKAISE